MKYYSDITDKLYDTPEQCADAERAAQEAARKQEEERKTKQAKIDELRKRVNELEVQRKEIDKQIDNLLDEYYDLKGYRVLVGDANSDLFKIFSHIFD